MSTIRFMFDGNNIGPERTPNDVSFFCVFGVRTLSVWLVCFQVGWYL